MYKTEMENLVAELVKQRQDIESMRLMITEMHSMMCKQQESMNNLDQHVEFVNGVYHDVVQSPLDWIRGKSSERRMISAPNQNS
jgi:hypothetical protein